MKLRIIRDKFTDKSTIGKLYVDSPYVFCNTLEDVDRRLENGGEKVYGQTCIPRGTYDVVIDYSSRFKKRMPHILNVPQFDGIRIHPGNTDRDTEGCILVGVTRGDDFIGDSRLAYNELMAAMENALLNNEKIELQVT